MLTAILLAYPLILPSKNCSCLTHKFILQLKVDIICPLQKKVGFHMKTSQAGRILTLYIYLLNGQTLNKQQIAAEFHCSEKAIQRDISFLKSFLADTGIHGDLVYNALDKGYQFIKKEDLQQQQTVLVLSKILFDSRAFNKTDITLLLDSLIEPLSRNEKQAVLPLLHNEKLFYTPLQHDQALIAKIWDFSRYINKKQTIAIDYQRADKKWVTRTILPYSLIFSEYYFYLICYNAKYSSHLIYRIDRIKSYRISKEKIYLEAKEKIEEGEFRKMSQFMLSGQATTIRFAFTGIVEAALDRLPTARIISQNDKETIIEADVYGDGVIMWLLSQGSRAHLLSPPMMVEKIKKEIAKMTVFYQ